MTRAPRIDAAAAWIIVREARAHADVSTAGSLLLDAPHEGTIRVERDGSWSSEVPVSADAAGILDLYLPLCISPRGPVIAQLGQSLDGRIATDSGASRYVTGRLGLLHLHRLRALADAVVVGAGTALADDPALTVRHADGDNPVRVIIDSNDRVPASIEVFHDNAASTLLLHADDSDRTPPGRAECVAVPRGDAGLDPAGILRVLGERGLHRILVEGGGVTVSRFITARLVDRLHVTVTPMIIGSGRPAFSLTPIDSLDDAMRPAWRRFDLGEDILFDLDLRADGSTTAGN